MPDRVPGGPPVTHARRSETAQLLFSRHFGPYFWGNLLSNCGTWFQYLAQSLLVFRLTHSTFLVGVVNFASLAGVVVLAPVAGSAADRFDRRVLLAWTQAISIVVTAAMAALAWTDRATAAIVIALAFVLGFATGFAAPISQALYASLVPRGQMASAVALNSITYNLARAVGPVLAAVTVSGLGIPEAFAINAASYLALLVALANVRPIAPHVVPGARHRLRDSLDVVRRNRRFLLPLVIVGVVGMSLDPVTTLSPAFASHVYHLDDTVAGFLIGAFGAGAVTAAFTIASRQLTHTRVASTLALIGIGIAAFGLSPSIGFGLGALFVTGLGYLASNTAATTILQLEVEESERGRLMALWAILFVGSRPLASLVDGALASALGVRAAALLMTPPVLLVALLVLRRGPAPWRRGSDEPA